MATIAWIVVITAIAGVVGTGVGGIIGAGFRRDSDRVVSLLLSFAGGVMLGVVCFDLIVNAMYPKGDSDKVSVYFVICGVLLGYGVIYALNYLIDEATNHELNHIDAQHPRTADALEELIHYDHVMQHRRHNEERKRTNTQYLPHPVGGHRGSSATQLFVAGLVMACAIALHNIPEGMVIGSSYAGAEQGVTFSGDGLVMAVIIGLHNIPEGMAVAVPLIAGGLKKPTAVLITALSGAPTIIGAVFGYYMGMASPLSLSLSLSFASGAMLYVVLGELLPESILMWRSKMPALAVLLGILTGLLIIYS